MILAETIFSIGLVLTDDELYEALDLSDESKDGKVSFHSFICYFLMGIRGGDRVKAEFEIIHRCFLLADCDGNGRLSRGEFRDVLKSAGLDLDMRQASRIFSDADTDKSGTISFEEFRDTCIRTNFTFRSGQEFQHAR